MSDFDHRFHIIPTAATCAQDNEQYPITAAKTNDRGASPRATPSDQCFEIKNAEPFKMIAESRAAIARTSRKQTRTKSIREAAKVAIQGMLGAFCKPEEEILAEPARPAFTCLGRKHETMSSLMPLWPEELELQKLRAQNAGLLKELDDLEDEKQDMAEEIRDLTTALTRTQMHARYVMRKAHELGMKEVSEGRFLRDGVEKPSPETLQFYIGRCCWENYTEGGKRDGIVMHAFGLRLFATKGPEEGEGGLEEFGTCDCAQG